MQKVFDYAGNEIKEGDEFVVIRVIKRQFFRAGIFIPAVISKSGKNEEILERKMPDDECFDIGTYHKVIVQKETLYELGYSDWQTISESGEIVTIYNTIELMKAFDMYDGLIIAIKGISDTKEYYDIWKKQQLHLT